MSVWFPNGTGKSAWGESVRRARQRRRRRETQCVRGEVIEVRQRGPRHFIIVERFDGEHVHFTLDASCCRRPDDFIRQLTIDTGLLLSGIPEHPLSFRRWLRAMVEATEEEDHETARYDS